MFLVFFLVKKLIIILKKAVKLSRGTIIIGPAMPISLRVKKNKKNKTEQTRPYNPTPHTKLDIF